MKITQVAYDRLRTSILNVLADYTDGQIVKHRQTINFVDDQFIAFCWSIAHRTNDNVVFWLYGCGYNDSHIETALKKILKKYKN